MNWLLLALLLLIPTTGGHGSFLCTEQDSLWACNRNLIEHDLFHQWVIMRLLTPLQHHEMTPEIFTESERIIKRGANSLSSFKINNRYVTSVINPRLSYLHWQSLLVCPIGLTLDRSLVSTQSLKDTEDIKNIFLGSKVIKSSCKNQALILKEMIHLYNHSVFSFGS